MNKELHQAFRTEACELPGIDRPVYEGFERDPREPIIGLGPRDATVAFFGRDPGREEVRHQLPFVGAGGQKIRATIHRVRLGTELPDFETSIEVGGAFFWANTVPYKPLGNKAWSMAVKKRFQPLMTRVLEEHWDGREIITLGREAFLWFGIGRDREQRQALARFWTRDDRFERSLDWQLGTRQIRLHPLPHPSPLNAAWFKRFDGLLEARLRDLDDQPRVSRSTTIRAISSRDNHSVLVSDE